jgi:hypothetical protein
LEADFGKRGWRRKWWRLFGGFLCARVQILINNEGARKFFGAPCGIEKKAGSTPGRVPPGLLEGI